MKKYILILLLLIPVVSAMQPSQQYVKIYMQPFYVNSMIQNYAYNYSFMLYTPDGYSGINSAIFTVDAWINPSRTFNAWINDIQCNTKNYTISTTYASAGRGVITFDCSNAVKTGYNNAKFVVSTGNIGSSTAWMDITYTNNPVGELKLHGTEYSYGQISKAWLQLLNSSGNHINNGVCYTDIYYPNMSQFLERATMSNANHDGLYYYDVELPFIEGVFPVIALCYYESGQVYNYATNITIINGSIDSGTINDTNSVDSTYLTTSETTVALGNPRRYDSRIYFNGNSICSNISELLLNGISIGWTGRWNSNIGSDVITMSLWNHSSSTWYILPNTITGVGTGIKTVTNSVVLNNISSTGFVNGSGTNMILRFQDTNLTDGTTTGLDYDYIYVACDRLSSPQWQTLRGSSEFHLSPSFNQSINATISDIASAVWNYPQRNLTYYQNFSIAQQDLTNYSLIASTVWNYPKRNLTYYLDVNISQIVFDVWNYPARYTHGELI